MYVAKFEENVNLRSAKNRVELRFCPWLETLPQKKKKLAFGIGITIGGGMENPLFYAYLFKVIMWGLRVLYDYGDMV